MFKNKILKNNFLATFLRIFLILYASLIAPKISEKYIKYFDNNIFKFTIIFLMALIGLKDINLSLLLAISLTLTMIFLKKKKTQRNIINAKYNLMDALDLNNDNDNDDNDSLFENDIDDDDILTIKTCYSDEDIEIIEKKVKQS